MSYDDRICEMCGEVYCMKHAKPEPKPQEFSYITYVDPAKNEWINRAAFDCVLSENESLKAEIAALRAQVVRFEKMYDVTIANNKADKIRDEREK